MADETPVGASPARADQPGRDPMGAPHPTDAPAVAHPLPRYQLLTPRAPVPPGAFVGLAPLPMARHHVPARWAEDPSGRHQWRWWNGYEWSDHVADDGIAGTDPLIPPGEPTSGS